MDSDKTEINFRSDGVQRTWQEPGQNHHSDCTADYVSVLLWDCMSAKGVGEMTFIYNSMQVELYTLILNEKMILV